MKKITEKHEYIGNYLDRSKKLNNHNLPYGIRYINLRAEVEEEAEKSWEKVKNKKIKQNDKIN